MKLSSAATAIVALSLVLAGCAVVEEVEEVEEVEVVEERGLTTPVLVIPPMLVKPSVGAPPPFSPLTRMLN